MNQQYFYQPLPPVAGVAKPSLFSRLIRLLAGHFYSPIRCSMIIVNIEQCVRYEALSYTWGSEAPQSSIEIDGRFLPIKPNLAGALQHLRLPNQDRYLWVDAVCINQDDTAEKTRQVLYMRQIYRNAARVLVWLGLKTPGIELAFQLASRLAELESLMMSDPSTGQGWDLGVRGELIRGAIRDSPPGSMEYLSELFHREYFSRIWCIQEVVACSWAVARCEELEVPFFDIISTSNLVHLYRGVSFSGATLEFWHQIYRARLALQAKQDPAGTNQGPEHYVGALINTLAGTRDFRATDPRDKVFALFGISKEGLDPVSYLTEVGGRERGKETMKNKFARRLLNVVGDFADKHMPDAELFRPDVLKPNYSKSCLEVYRDFARHQMTRGARLLHILHHVHHNEPLKTGNFPSWVPKWFEPMKCQVPPAVLYLTGICASQSPYHASVHDNPQRGGAIHPDTLTIDGFWIDEVTMIGDLLEIEENGTIPMERLWQGLFGYPLFPRPHKQTYRNGEPLDVAFSLTLGMGILGTVTMVGLEARHAHRNVARTAESGPEGLELENIMLADVQQFMTDFYTSRGFQDQCPAINTVPDVQGKTIRYENGSRIYATGRRTFLTRNGYLGQGPGMMQAGDQVCVLYGGRLPFVIRPTGDNRHHFLVGPCYIHDYDILWGVTCEAVRFKHPNCQFREQTFQIL